MCVCTDYEGYSAPGDEIIVPDMHTRKKMMFDSVSDCNLHYVVLDCVCPLVREY